MAASSPPYSREAGPQLIARAATGKPPVVCLWCAPFHCSGFPLQMLALLRSSLNTWPVRIFFGLLIAAFGVWGIGNVLPDILGSDNTAARVGGVSISPQDVQSAYRQQMQQA